MAENIKLKDLYNEEQSYTDIGTIAVPKTDGSGDTYYVQRPIINYTLQDPPTHELTDADAGVFAWNAGDGAVLVDDVGNFRGSVTASATGKTTQPIVTITVTRHLSGATVNGNGVALLVYLYEDLPGSVLLDVLGETGNTGFTAQAGWGQLLLADTESREITGYAKINDPGAVTIGIEQPVGYQKADIFYSLLSEVTQEEQTVSVTENGEQTIVPTAGKSGIRKVALNVNVAGGGGGGGSVSFIDYDGTVIETWALSSLASKTELPTPPAHDRLVFQQWNWTLEDIKAANAEMTVGALYTTASGLTEFHIRVTKGSGLAITCNMVGNKNWGDGTEDALTSHTYADYGDYIITCDGNAIALNVMGETQNVRDTLFRVSISNSVTLLWTEAFNVCYALQSVSIPNSVTSIGNRAFNYCHSLQSVSIPNSVTSINQYAFSSCYALQSVSIPNSVTSINQYAFSSCYSLQSVSIPNSVTSIDQYAFSSCSSLQSVSISNSVKSIGNNAFGGCYALQSVSIPNSVTSIGSSAFNNCRSLQSVSIQNGVKSIGYQMFNYCYALQSVSIPNSVTSIGSSAFGGCCVWEYDFSQFSKVPTLGSNAFSGILSSTKILVPSALYDTWVTATNWSKYANYIVGV